MIRTLTDTLPEYDLCIIGAGPAGLTLAAELAYTELKICVIESGHEKHTAFADTLKEVESELLPIKSSSRERVFGGASTVWGGLSAPLDAIDYESREWSEGWPIVAGEIEPFLQAAGRYRFPTPDTFTFKSDSGGWTPLKNLHEKIFLAVRPPYNFASLRSIFARTNVDLVLRATVIEIISQEGVGGLRKVVEVVCGGFNGEHTRIKARMFVVAAGGIENARLLLSSNIGNEHDQVGRYFMNHPKGYAGLLQLHRHLPATSPYLPRIVGGRMVYAGLTLSADFQRTHGLLNSCVQFEPRMGFLERYSFALWRRLPAFASKVCNVLRPRYLRPRWFADMEARAENRVTLGDRRDVFGVRLPVVSYTLGPRDRSTLVALFEQLQENVKRLGIGILEGTAEDVVFAVTQDASHHLGSTRMGNDPKSSVVDTNCRVHSTTNMYVAGGSVFPTGGSANPTMTIVALSIRLAQHIQKELGGRNQNENTPSSHGVDQILIIGAGKRVREDVVPALESLATTYTIKGIYARHSSVISGSHTQYEVQDIISLNAAALSGVRFVYVAVPTPAIQGVLKQVAALTGGAVEVIVDTPVPTSRATRAMLARFIRVHVAEDSVFLPWLEDSKKQNIQRIDCVQSVYRYHGIALIKALSGKVVWGWRWRNTLHLRARGARVTILEPREYARGRLYINGAEVAFPELTPAESLLVGSIAADDTIVSRMLDLKRVGLRRLLAAAAEGDKTWSLEEGCNDTKIDRILHRYWIYVAFLP